MTDFILPLDHKLPTKEPYSEAQFFRVYRSSEDNVHKRLLQQNTITQITSPRNVYLSVLADTFERGNPKPGHNDARWIFQAIASTDHNGAKLINEIIDGVNRLIAKQQYWYLDRVFDIVPPETAGRHVLLALLRASAPVSSKLTGWKHYVDRVRQAFEARGLESGRLLRGLLD